MRISVWIGFAAVAALSAGCATPADMIMAGMCSDQECFDVQRAWAEGRAPSPHQMTTQEQYDLADKSLRRELDYAKHRQEAMKSGY